MVKSRFAALAVACVAVFPVVPLSAATITSAGSGAWNNTTTWSPQQIPTSSDDVVIIGGTGISIPTGYTALAQSLTIQGDIASPASLDLDASGAQLFVTNGVSMTAPGVAVVDQIIVGQGQLSCGAISLDAGASGGISRLVLSSGSINASGNITFAGTSTNAEIKMTSTGQLMLSGDLGSGGTLAASTGSIVNFVGSGPQAVGPYSYYNLSINKPSGTATLSGAINVGVSGTGGDLNIGSGTLDDNGNQITGNSSGSLVLGAGTKLLLGSSVGATSMPSFAVYSFAAASTVSYKSFAAQTVSAVPIYGNLDIDKNSSTGTVSGSISLNGNLTVTSGTLDLQSYSHLVAGNWTNSGTVLAGTSTVSFNGGVAQTINRGGSSFNHIVFSGAGTKGFSGSGLLVLGDLTINAGATVDFGSMLHQIAGNWTNNGNFAGTGSTIDFNGAAGTQNIGASGFYNVSFSGAATKSATGALTFVNNVVINSGSNFDAGSFTHDVGGSWTNSGSFTPSASTINFNGGSAQSISASSFKNVTFSGAGTKSFTGNVSIFANLTINSGATLDAGSGSHNIGGNFTNNGVVINSSSSWNFNGTSPQTIGGSAGAPFNNLTVNNGLGVSLSASILVNGTLTLGGFKITTGANAVSLGNTGSLSRTSGYVNGTLTKKSATGTFSFDVGTAAGYSPVAMVITGTADITVSAIAGSACCFFAGANHLAHYWQIQASTPVNANLTFNWPVGEVTGTEANYILANYASSWTYYSGAVDDSTHVATLTGALLPASLVSWSVGEGASLAGSPTIAGFSPTSGPIGTSVTISGSAFTGASAVTFNSTNAITYSVDNDTQITATVPSGATTGPVSVTTPGGTTSNGTFTVASAPTIASFSPTAGSIGVTVTITGSNFTGATSVTFNGTSATFNVDNDNQITATLPGGATTGQIAVTTPSGTGTSAGSFTVNAPGLIKSAASGNWSSPSTWVGNIPPGTFDNVEILSGHTVTLTANATCNGLAVDSGSTLNIGSNTLTDSASGSFFGAVSGSGSLIFSNNGNDSIDGNITIAPPVIFQGDRTMAATSSLAFSSGINITTGVTLTNNGAVHVDNANGITGTGTFVQGTNAVVTNSGPFLPTGSLNAIASPNLIDYNGAAQTVKATTYHNLILSGSGSKDITGLTTINGYFTLNGSASTTATANMTIGGDVTLQSGTSFTLGALTHSIGGNWTNNGASVSQAGSTVIFNGGSAQTITRGTQGFNNVEFSGAGTKSMSGAGLFCTGNVQIDGGATFDGGAFAHQVTGNWVNNGTFTAGTSTVEFQSGTPSTISGNFATLIVNKTASTVSLGSDLTVSITLQLSSGTLITGTSNATVGAITGSGALTMSSGTLFISGNTNSWTGTFTPGSGTVELTGTSAQSMRGGTFNNVNVNKASGTVTMQSALTVNGLLHITSGTLFDNGFQMVAGGSATLQVDNAGTLKLGSGVSATSLPPFSGFTLAASSTVMYAAGSALQQINTTPNYGHLVVDSGTGSGITKTLAGATLNAATLDVTNTGGSVTLDLQNKTANVTGNVGGGGAITFGSSPGNLNIGGNFSSTGTFTAGSSTVTFNGSGAQSIRATTYNNLTIANSGTATLSGATILNGALVVSPGASFSMNVSLLRIFGNASNDGTFDAGANTLDLRGDFTNNGTFVGTSGTVAFNGSVAQNWGGTFATTLNNVSTSNGAGLTISNSMTVNGTFSLGGANVAINGGQQVAISSTGSISLFNSSYFVGKLQIYIPASTTMTFPLGTGSGYAPVDVTPSASGPFTITSVSGAQPNATGANVLSRYWTFGTATTPGVNLKFYWDTPDVTGAESIYTAARYNGSWTRPTTSIDTVNHTATVNGITSYAGDWTVGEPLSLGASATCTSLPANAISWWRAEGNAVDDHGANNGALTGGAITAGGKVNQGFQLAGSGQYVSVPDSASLHPASLSVEAWVYFNAAPTGVTAFVSKPFANSTNDSFAIWYESSALRGGIADGAGFGTILNAAWTPIIGTWYHVAYTFDGGTQNQALYLNGVQVASGNAGKTPTYDGAPLLIGADLENATPSLFLNGFIDEVTLYGRALTAAEVASVYGADSAGKCFTAIAPSIGGFSPTSGVAGTTVTITGTGFIGASIVTFNGVSAAYTVNSDTQITATVPAGATSGPIAVTNAGGTDTSAGNFTVFSGTADLSISVTAPLTATVNTAFNYTIGVNNLGPDPAAGVTVTSTLPASFTYNSHTTSGPWSCGFSAPTLTCTAVTLATGAQPNIVVNVTPTTTGNMASTAGIASTGTLDSNGANDSATASTTINPASADLAVAHSVSPGSVGNGGTIAYQIVTTNNGPSNATGVTVTEVLPANVTYSGATGATCNNVSGTVTCTVGGIAASNSNTITITTTANAVGTATATASATATESDPNGADNANVTASSTVTGSTVIVTNSNDSGANSLRQAILDANAAICTAPCNIQFAIGSGAHTIALNSGLPALTVPVVIDGTTQPGYSGTPLITIDVINDTTNSAGLILNGDNSTVKALAIVNSHNVGIVIGGTTGGNTVVSCVITGHAADGIRVNSASNTIGGSTAALRNVISGNGNSGVVLFGTASMFNTVRGNYIGTNAAGNAASANGFDGVQILDGASTNMVDLNVISGNSNSGIYLTSSTASPTMANVAAGNLIGTDATGAFAVPNGVAGIYIGCTAPGNAFGGIPVPTRNVIAGNPFGIRILGCGSDGEQIRGNYIGVGSNGTTAIANGVGIALEGGAAQTIIGGTTAGDENLIANSTAAGVSIAAPAAGNGILHNAMYGNGTGINLDNLSLATINDATDSDTGANNLQNSPVIGSAALSGSTLDVTFSVDSSSVAATQSLVVEVFKADASGQGKTLLGSQCFNGNSIGNTITIPSAPVAIGDPIVATATSYATACAAPTPSFSDGTSPFSASLAVTCAPPTSSVTAPSSVCANSTGNTASVPFTSGATYAWTISNGTITTGQGTSSILFDAGASGTVSLGITVTLGCSSTGSANVPIGAATATITPSGSTSICAGSNVTLTASSGTSYQWFKNAVPLGLTTQSISVNAAGSYTVTVTNGSCSATSSATVVTVNPNPTPSITGPSTVCPGTSFTLDAGGGFAGYLWSNGATTQTLTTQTNFSQTYSVTVTDSNGCSGTASHAVTVTSAPSATITAPASTNANASGLTASVPAGASSYLWTITNGTITAGQGTPSITFSIGASSALLGVTVSNGTCSATGTKSVQISNLADLAIGITASPDPVAPGGTLTYTVQLTNNGPTAANNPVITDTLPAGATLVSASGAGWNCFGAPNVQCSAQSSPVGANSPITIVVTAPQDAGPITNSVSVSSSTNDPASSNNSKTITTTVSSANCNPHGAPVLNAPAPNATVTSPVTFSWQPVPEAVGYRVSISVNGAADAELGTTDGAIFFTHEVPSGAITWVVDALFNGCPSTRSARNGFTVPAVDGCAGHAAPTLVAPANNSTSGSSSIDFQWNGVAGASGYRVWIAVDGAAAEVAGETDGTSLHSTIASGAVDWYVEALFDGCASISSSHFLVTVPKAQNCGNDAATLTSPANNSTTSNSIATFTWNGVANATGYELYASLDNGSPVLLGTTSTTTLTKEVGAGLLKWFVRALFDGCPSRDSQTFAFLYAPPADCKAHQRPLLTTPIDGSTAVVSPVKFEWSDVGASSYKLFLNAQQLNSSTPQQLTPGNYDWYVEADFEECPPLRSTTSHFTVVTKSGCVVPAKPTILAPSEVSTGIAYKVRWLPAFGADAYVVQEANNSAFANATTHEPTTDNMLTFSHPNPGTFFYRVRGISNCTTQDGAFSATVGVSILPQNSSDGATSPDAPSTLLYSIPLDAALAGQTFTATPTEPWLTVTPASGTIPPGGLTLTVTANTAGLPLGTSLGGVTITTATPSSSRYASNGNSTSTTTLTVNVVQPVSPTSKNTPPPDALIIPAVAHADGFNSHFQSDVRLTNTSPQPMKYQLTFTPSGEDGLANGKQATIDVDPGRTIALDDILKTWFSSGSTDGAAGTLEIRPLTSTQSKVTSNAISGLANLVTFASSRTFNNATNGTFGQYIPAIPFANFIGKGSGTITLQQIAQSANYRTNLGLVEGSGQPVSLLVSIFGSNGQKIKDVPVDLKGGQHTQLNSFLASQGLTLEDARVEVKVATGSGKVTAYASLLDNKTSDPLLVTPTLLTTSGSTKYVVPGVAALDNGFANWRSDMRVFNASSSKVDAQLTFVSLNGTTQTQSLTLAPNEVKQFDDIVRNTFGASNDGGAIHISTASPVNLIATARTYNLTTNGTYGQFISAVTPNDAAAVGTRPLQLLQIEESDRYRTNVGLAEVNGKPAKVEVTVVPPDSKVSAVVQLDLAANEFRQLNQILKSVGLENTYNARVTVQVIDGAGKVTAYASVIDQVTQDPTLLQAQ